MWFLARIGLYYEPGKISVAVRSGAIVQEGMYEVCRWTSTGADHEADIFGVCFATADQKKAW